MISLSAARELHASDVTEYTVLHVFVVTSHLEVASHFWAILDLYSTRPPCDDG